MGSGPSLEAEAEATKAIATKFLDEFANSYTTLRSTATIASSLNNQQKGDGFRKWELLKCADDSTGPIRKQGEVRKLSKHLKWWNSRFLVVQRDWTVAYWGSEAQFKQGQKPRGTLNLSGMKIVRDVEAAHNRRDTDLAEKWDSTVSEAPQLEPFPPFTLMVDHDLREGVLLQCSTHEEHRAWCDILEACSAYAPSLTIRDDKTHRRAFQAALTRTRRRHGMQGSWHGGGTEEQQLVECIYDVMKLNVMPEVDKKISANKKVSWISRAKRRAEFECGVRDHIATTVKTAWTTTVYENVGRRDERRDAVTTGDETQCSLQRRIIKAADNVCKDAIGQHFEPHVEKNLQNLFVPINDAFVLVLQAYDAALLEGKATYTPHAGHRFLVQCVAWNAKFTEADRKLDALFETVEGLQKDLVHLCVWSIVGRARRRLRKMMRNALFTFETRLEEQGGAQEWERVAAETREVMKCDCRAAIVRVLGQVLFDAFEACWFTEATQKLVDSAEQLVGNAPENATPFLDAVELIERTLKRTLMLYCFNVAAQESQQITL
jgi:hypothetical protein